MANDFAPLLSLPHLLPSKARDVWSWNLEVELQLFLVAVAAAGSEGVIALDCEFPGLVRKVPENATADDEYEALRVNVELVRPIQMGFAVADHSGQILGVWRFNLCFCAGTDHHFEGALSFLASTGLELRRHATEGIDAVKLGRRLAAGLFAARIKGSPRCSLGPQWVTFSGELNFGYFLNILTPGQALPASVERFEVAMGRFCPQRVSLKKLLAPYGSLDSWIALRHSDALSTLRLFLRVHMQKGSSGAGREVQNLPDVLQVVASGSARRGAAPPELWGPAALLAAGSSATRRPQSAATALWGPAALISTLERV